MFLSAFAPALWEQLKDAVALEELLDERFQTQAGRLEHNDELQAVLTGWTLSKTSDELRVFAQKGYPITVAETPERLLRSEQWARRNFVYPSRAPGGGEGVRAGVALAGAEHDRAAARAAARRGEQGDPRARISEMAR